MTHLILELLVSSCSCPCPIHWSQVLSREWRCSWSRARQAVLQLHMSDQQFYRPLRWVLYYGFDAIIYIYVCIRGSKSHVIFLDNHWFHADCKSAIIRHYMISDTTLWYIVRCDVHGITWEHEWPYIYIYIYIYIYRYVSMAMMLMIFHYFDVYIM